MDTTRRVKYGCRSTIVTQVMFASSGQAVECAASHWWMAVELAQGPISTSSPPICCKLKQSSVREHTQPLLVTSATRKLLTHVFAAWKGVHQAFPNAIHELEAMVCGDVDHPTRTDQRFVGSTPMWVILLDEVLWICHWCSAAMTGHVDLWDDPGRKNRAQGSACARGEGWLYFWDVLDPRYGVKRSARARLTYRTALS